MKKYLGLLFTLLLFGNGFATAEETSETAAPASSAAQASLPQIPRSEPQIDQTVINTLIASTPLGTELIQRDTSKTGEKLIGFYLTEASGIQQGGILFFPDENTHLDWPGALNNLRTGLTQYGWYTLAIYLPRPPKIDIPKRTLPVLTSIAPSPGDIASVAEQAAPETEATPDTTESAATTVETANDSAATSDSEAPATDQEPYQDKVARLGQSAIEYLQQQGIERFVVVGLGSGAVWAARYVEQFEESQDLRLVMIDPSTPRVSDAPDLISLLPEIESTIIDLHHSPAMGVDNSSPINPERRLRTARHNRMNNYHQSRLPPLRDDWKKENSWLLKQLRGLLNTYVIKAEKMAREQQVKSAEPMENAPGGLKSK